MSNLLSINDLNRDTIEQLLERGEQLLQTVVKKNGQLPLLNGQVVANLFFEPSTRTQFSFSIAAQRLGASVLNPLMEQTSTSKGESLLDTVRSFVAMGARAIVIRQRENHALERLANGIGDTASIINGGDGTNQHPTQALLDLLTIRQHKGNFSSLKVAIIGDIARSRVARSLVQALTIMGCQQINIIAPPEFLPSDFNAWSAKHYSSIAEGIPDADVVVALRIQLERILPIPELDAKQFLKNFTLTLENLHLAHPKAIVMHPGPINRDIEITTDVADCKQSVILQQITNGVAMRMAVIEWLLGTRNGQ